MMKIRNTWFWLSAAVLTATVFTCGFATPAAAQGLTAESLLKSSIEEIGPQHREVADAIEDFKKGQFLECRNKLKSARTKDPKLPHDGILMAKLLYAANQAGLARAELERVVKEEPTDPEPFLLFGEIGFQQRRYSDSSLAFQRAGQLIKNFKANDFRNNNMKKRAFSGLAGVAEARKDWVTATKYLQTLVSANPKDVATSTRLARALFQQDTTIDGKGKEKEAIQVLQNLYKANPAESRRPEIIMASMYQSAGEKNFAAGLMKRVATSDTGGLATQLSVARWALSAGDLQLAQQCSDRALQINSGSVEVRLIAGLTARYKKDYPTARKILEAAHLQTPSNLAAILQLAVVLIEGSDADKRTALEYSQVGSRMFPDMGSPSGREAAVTTAWVLYRVGRLNEAGQILQKALAGGSVSAESSYYAAEIIHRNNPDVAKKLLTTALKGDGVFPARPEAENLMKSLGG